MTRWILGLAASIVLAGTAASNTYHDDATPYYVHDGFGLAVIPQIDLEYVTLDVKDDNVLVAIDLNESGDPRFEESSWIYHEMYFDGEGLDYGVVYFELRDGVVNEYYLFMFTEDGLPKFWRIDASWNASTRVAVLSFPREYVPTNLSDIYFETHYAVCQKPGLCQPTVTGALVFGDRMPNSGFYPPFNTQTGVWG